MGLELRLASDEVDAVMLFKAACYMHSEGVTPGKDLDTAKTFKNICRMVYGPTGASLMAMEGDTLVGFLNLWEDGFWFNNERFLTDKGFYVLPEFRDGDAARLLLDAAKQLSEDVKLPIYITINNVRRRRGGRSEWERLGATLGYTPQGAVLAHFPGE